MLTIAWPCPGFLDMGRNRKPKKGSKANNLAIRWKRISNGLGQANEKSPVFLFENGRILRLTPEQAREREREQEIENEATYLRLSHFWV